MSNEEIALLKADNERLNKIIGIVVEQNELLKLENAFLKKAVTPKDIINSFAKIGMSIKANENALAKLDNGLSNVSNELVNVKEGNNNVTKDIASFNNGNNTVTEGLAESDDARSNVVEVMPATIIASDNIIGALEKELKTSGYNRISHSGVNNAAKLLIHFYNKGDGSYPKLRKVTGHSTDGIAKFIMSMKKRGWIHRYGFQQFGLTEQGVALIKQTLSKSREN